MHINQLLGGLATRGVEASHFDILDRVTRHPDRKGRDMRLMGKALRTIGAPVTIAALALSLVACGNAGAGTTEPTATDAEVTPVAREAKSDASTTVYFAGPLFCKSELDFNLELVQVLEDAGYTVFLPQRDGFLAAELEGKSEEELTQMIFDKDASEVMKADVLVFNLDGRVPDEGACVELGIAYASGKRCYGIRTDVRTVERGLELNPMITGCFTHLFNNSNGDELIEEIRAYLAENEL